jgi:hypothetical protein
VAQRVARFVIPDRVAPILVVVNLTTETPFKCQASRSLVVAQRRNFSWVRRMLFESSPAPDECQHHLRPKASLQPIAGIDKTSLWALIAWIGGFKSCTWRGNDSPVASSCSYFFGASFRDGNLYGLRIRLQPVLRFSGMKKGRNIPAPLLSGFDKTLLRALVAYFSQVPVYFKRLTRRGCRLVCRWPFTGSSIASSRRLSVSFHFLTNMGTQRIGIHSS